MRIMLFAVCLLLVIACNGRTSRSMVGSIANLHECCECAAGCAELRAYVNGIEEVLEDYPLDQFPENFNVNPTDTEAKERASYLKGRDYTRIRVDLIVHRMRNKGDIQM